MRKRRAKHPLTYRFPFLMVSVERGLPLPSCCPRKPSPALHIETLSVPMAMSVCTWEALPPMPLAHPARAPRAPSPPEKAPAAQSSPGPLGRGSRPLRLRRAAGKLGLLPLAVLLAANEGPAVLNEAFWAPVSEDGIDFVTLLWFAKYLRIGHFGRGAARDWGEKSKGQLCPLLNSWEGGMPSMVHLGAAGGGWHWTISPKLP